MDVSFKDRMKNVWNVFKSNFRDFGSLYEIGNGSPYRPDRGMSITHGDRAMVTSIYNRIALDVSSISIRHVRLDKDGRYSSDINSGLNNCLTLSSNLDQTARAFVQDAVMSMLEEGVIALVPIDTDVDPAKDSYEIFSMRVGKILEWYPQHVKVNVYNEATGLREDIIVDKKNTAIIESPLYSVINEPNSTMRRLMRKIALLDIFDERANSGKLDLIIQLPYSVRSKLKMEQAEKRRNEIVQQLTDSVYGIAYTDTTEKVIQLNRPIENNLQTQVAYLTEMLFGQLGMTKTILDGTADESTMLNYYSRTIEPILAALIDEMKRKFLTKTARTQGQSIMFFRDPFKLVPVSQIADIADKFTRNEILSSNELRQIIGIKPSADPEADELRNKNLNKSKQELESEFGPKDNQKMLKSQIPENKHKKPKEEIQNEAEV